jgi:Uma2 family endonuclease
LLQDKLSEYMAAGTQLGWLIDPEARVVFLYRPNVPPERLEHPATISGDPVLPGCVLDLGPIWEPGV